MKDAISEALLIPIVNLSLPEKMTKAYLNASEVGVKLRDILILKDSNNEQ